MAQAAGRAKATRVAENPLSPPVRLRKHARVAYMWSSTDMTIEIDEIDPPTILARIATPIGAIDLIGDVSVVDGVLYIMRAHIGGLAANALGIAGLNAIGRKLLEEAGVAKIVVEGGARTSGRCNGRIPRLIRFPRGGDED